MSLDLRVDATILVVAVLLVGAVLTAALAARPGSRFRVPGALLFLGIGMAVGDDGLGFLQVSDAALVRDIGVVALLIILFEGGLTTKPTDLRLAAVPGLLLSTVGVVVTAAITGGAIWLLFDLDPVTAGLIGAVVASTDAAAVFSMMRSTRLPRKVSAIVRIESGANDPIAVMLTVGLLATLESGAVGPGAWLTFAAVQLLGGVAVGAAVGALAVQVLRRVELGVEGLYPILAIGLGGVAYGVAAWIGASGFVAVYLTGLLIGAMVPRHRRGVLGVNEALANAAEVGLFLLLGLLVFPSRLPAVIVPGLAIAAVLVLVARPAAVALCTAGARLGWREQALISWAGLRGAVPIVLATFPFTAGVQGGAVLFDIVFFVVLVSVLVQGTTLQSLVRRLGLADGAPAWSPVAEALPLYGVDIDLIEVFVTDELAIVDQRLRDIGNLDRTRIAAIIRQHRVVIPDGATRVRAGDVLLFTAERRGDVAAMLTQWARGERARRTRQPGEPYADG